MSVFEVVPGKYELAWKLVDDVPQLQNYAVSLKLKLRLKKKVNVKEEIINQYSEAEKDHVPYDNIPFQFQLLDPNGKVYDSVQPFSLEDASFEEIRHNNVYFNKDQTMDFLRFLQSEPGKEIELLLYTIGHKTANWNCIDACKNAKGIICVLSHEDETVEKCFAVKQFEQPCDWKTGRSISPTFR